MKYTKEIIIGFLLLSLAGVYFNKSQLLGGVDTATFTKGLDNVSVMVKIKEQTSEGEYNDALYYKLDDWLNKCAEDIKSAKKARVDKWVNYIKEAKATPPSAPTKEELQAEKENMLRQLDLINAQILQ